MISETSRILLEALDHLEDLRAELASKKHEKAETMKPVNYRFPSSVKSGVVMLSELIEFSESDVARAAMYIGLKEIKRVHEMDGKKARGLMHLIKIRAKLGK